MPRFDRTTLYPAADLWLSRVSCDGDDGVGPEEERSDEDCVIFVLRGRFVFRDRRTRAVIDPRRALVLRAGEPHTIGHPGGGGDVCLSIGGRRLSRILGAAGPTTAVSAEEYLRMHALAGRLARRAHCDARAVEEMVCRALRPPHAPAPAAGRDREVAGTIAFLIDLRFDDRMTLRELAGAADVSVFHACRAFRRAMGTSIHRYRQTVRLWHALALLRDTAWPISRIAVEAGFANQGHLTNVFRRRLGATPGQAREGRLSGALALGAPSC